MTRWLYVPEERVALLYAYRADAGVESADAVPGGVYLRGFAEGAAPAIPGAELLTVAEDGLHRDGERLPFATVPRLAWWPLHQRLPLAAPGIVDEGAVVQSGRASIEVLPWRLVADPTPPAPTALWLDAAYCAQLLDSGRSYAATFASVRLERIRFCWVDGRALLRGTPLLPLPGEAFAGEGDLVPLGYRFEHPALVMEVRQVLAKADSDTVVWHADGSYTIVPAHAWQSLAYANARYSEATPPRRLVQKVEWGV